MSILSVVPRACAEGTRKLVEHLIVRPLQGLVEIANGVGQAGPHLVRATTEAVVEAVDGRLSADARQNIRQGADRVLAGAKLLTAPVTLAVLIWVFLHPTIVYVGWLASMIVVIGMAAG